MGIDYIQIEKNQGKHVKKNTEMNIIQIDKSHQIHIIQNQKKKNKK